MIKNSDIVIIQLSLKIIYYLSTYELLEFNIIYTKEADTKLIWQKKKNNLKVELLNFYCAMFYEKKSELLE